VVLLFAVHCPPLTGNRVWSPGLWAWLGPTGPNVGELPLSSTAIQLPHPVYHMWQRSNQANLQHTQPTCRRHTQLPC
jgi:hypothetical protein